MELIINEIDYSLHIASKHGGKVFGGYVRGVLVPRSFDPHCDVSFKDVDLWFTDRKSADRFVAEMGGKFRPAPGFSTTPENQFYPFHRLQYHYFVKDTCIAWFDLIISETFPVDDFDVNCLTFSYFNDQTVWSVEEKPGMDTTSQEILMRRILAKEARLLSTMDVLLSDQPAMSLQRQHILPMRFQRRYHALGWKIMRNSFTCVESTFSSATSFRCWLRHASEPATVVTQQQSRASEPIIKRQETRSRSRPMSPMSKDAKIREFDGFLDEIRARFLDALNLKD